MLNMLCTLLVAACVTDNGTTAVATPFRCNDLNKFASQAPCPDASQKCHCLEHMKTENLQNHGWCLKQTSDCSCHNLMSLSGVCL